MIKDIDNIDNYETRTKVNTTKWTPIYELVDEAYIKGSKNFSDYFIKKCKDNSNEARDIPRDVKITLIEWKCNKDYMHKWSCYVERIWNFLQQIRKNEAKFKFQGQFTRSQQWFDLDFDWI